MLELSLDSHRSPSCVLLLGAHCDDIEIGCGGTLSRMARRWPSTEFVWITLASEADRAEETRRAAERLLAGVRHRTILIESFRGSYLPYDGAALKDYFETLKRFEPELVFTHFRHDLHQDHRIVNQLTWNTFRDHVIFEYEIPKFDGDLAVPNAYVPLGESELAEKVSMLLECFPSQRSRAWFTRSTFEALARLRGIECNAPDGYAEAFFVRKARLAF